MHFKTPIRTDNWFRIESVFRFELQLDMEHNEIIEKEIDSSGANDEKKGENLHYLISLIERIFLTVVQFSFLQMSFNLAHYDFLFWLQYSSALYSEARVCYFR